jgi:hypothetical protein
MTDGTLGAETAEIYCPRALYKRWRNTETAEIAELWASLYPFLFDEQDLEIARNQRSNHFNEWFTAIHLFHEAGAVSMVEKFDQPSHHRKLERYERIVPASERESLLAICNEEIEGHRVQLPDLLVTSRDGSTFWFVETKGPHEPVSARQLISHDRIRGLGVRVEVLRVEPI